MNCTTTAPSPTPDATRLIDRIRGILLEFYLNYTPTELDLKANSRRAIDEGIIKGMGVLWTELYKPQGADFQLVGSLLHRLVHGNDVR